MFPPVPFLKLKLLKCLKIAGAAKTNLMYILPYSDVGCTLWNYSASRARTELRSNNNMKRKGAAQFACFVLLKAAAVAAAGWGEGLLCL